MTNAFQMNFNFDEPSEMGRFLEKVKECEVDDLYVSAEMLTDHFQEAKTKELIRELKAYLTKKEQHPEPLIIASMPANKNLKAEKEAQRLLKQKLEEKGKLRKSSYPQIFADDGYQRFQLTSANYTKDDHAPKAKFSNLFHFFKYEKLLICTQLEYIDFVEMEYEVHLSKILPATRKYEEYILPLLARISKVRQIE